MLRSPPSRRRGLKFSWLNGYQKRYGRLLRGGVDWNSFFHSITSSPLVASFAEAWIEILMISITGPIAAVASFAEAWIEILFLFHCLMLSKSPPSRRRGLKCCYLLFPWDFPSRLLRGGVDWNPFLAIAKSDGLVASFAEAWIEIYLTICPELS